MSKVILVTGASSGIGKETSFSLLKRGYKVYCVSRHTQKMKDLKEKGAITLKMDVSDDKSVKSTIKKILKKEARIDVLINNAGYGSYGTIEDISIDEAKYQYEVNVFGSARVLKEILPNMRKKRKGTIIQIASVASYVSPAGMGWYASTKHAIMAICDSLRQEVKHLGIKVSLIEPGPVKTNFDTIALNKIDHLKISKDYKNLMKGVKNSVIKMYENCPGPKETVEAIVHAVESENPKAEYRTTPDAKKTILLTKFLSKKTVDNIILKGMEKEGKK